MGFTIVCLDVNCKTENILKKTDRKFDMTSVNMMSVLFIVTLFVLKSVYGLCVLVIKLSHHHYSSSHVFRSLFLSLLLIGHHSSDTVCR